MKLLKAFIALLLMGMPLLEYDFSIAKESKGIKSKAVKKVKKKKRKSYRWVRASTKVNRKVDGDKIKLENMIRDIQ